ncbi:MAG: hypothetical protein WC415_06455 [Patescibacteria group bacterium]|jgi:biopolymer transport protein ExbD
MGIFIGIVFLLISIFMVFTIIITIINLPKEKKQYQERIEQQNVLSETTLYHLGGHPYLQVNDKIFFQIRNNNTIYFYKENTDTGKEISISELLKYEIKTESQISKDVTLTRLLALGIFAFGVKKQTKIEEQYLILSYIQNGIEINCIFKRFNQETQLGDIVSTITRLKIEENRKKECV